MDAPRVAIAENCLRGAEEGQMSFPQIVAALTAGGFDGYLIDYRRNLATYYLSDGANVAFDMAVGEAGVDGQFDAQALKAAIIEAQAGVPGYSYRGFCEKAKAAGCAGYLVSVGGRRVVYFARSGETHTEFMPPCR